ncbi:MAG: tryptophan--tRNA ligase [Candidatus Altiarchaeales archaeon IMC4]|nr:MAG: tryptophan--tRNA ligase [Candidatus Altiarchaeales archaeon IMC4]
MTQRLDPWGQVKIEDYRKLFDEFGIESFEKFKNRFSENRYVRRGIVFGHRDFDKIVSAIDSKKPYVMITGLMPSGKFHFGHKMVAEQMIWHQKLGAEIYVCVADMESYLMRGISFEDARKIAVDEYLTNYIALGLTEKNLHVYFQSDYVVAYYRFRDSLSGKATLNELKAIYGELTPSKIFSVFTQVADILHVQLGGFSGKVPTVVPVGPDQDPHIRLTRDIASKLDLIQPSSTYHKFMTGLQGGKMSSSDPKSHIALTEDLPSAKKKLMGAKTGGRATAEEQKKLGGVPEECAVYELMVYHLVEDDKELLGIHDSCTSEGLSCGECKKVCWEKLEKFLTEHQVRRQNGKKAVENLIRIIQP